MSTIMGGNGTGGLIKIENDSKKVLCLSPSIWETMMIPDQSLSVVQSLMARQLGFHCKYSKSQNEKMTCRHLVNARSVSDADDDDGTPTATPEPPVLLKLNGEVWVPPPPPPSAAATRRNNCDATTTTTTRNRASSADNLLTWRQLVIPSPSISVTIEAGTFWERRKNGRDTELESCFVLDNVAGSELKLLARYSSATGKITETTVTGGSLRSLISSEYNSTYLVSLLHGGRVRVFDFVKRGWEEFPLRKSAENVHFEDLTFDDTTGVMYIIGTADGRTRTVYVASYPPWTIHQVIHVGFPTQFEIFDSVVCFKKGTSVEISTWEYVANELECTNVLISESHPDAQIAVPGSCEQVLRTKPKILASIPTKDNYFGILDTLCPPLYFARTATNFKISAFAAGHPLWKHSNQCGEAKLALFPDESNRAIFSAQDSSSVLTFKKNEATGSYEVEPGQQPFTLPQQNPVRSTTAKLPLVERPRRQAYLNANAKPTAKTYFVQAVGYSEVLDLIGVAIIDELVMHITLYYSKTLKTFKRLRSFSLFSDLQAKRANSRDDTFSNQAEVKLSWLSLVSMSIFPNFVAIEMSYANKKYSSDVFFLRLM